MPVYDKHHYLSFEKCNSYLFFNFSGHRILCYFLIIMNVTYFIICLFLCYLIFLNFKKNMYSYIIFIFTEIIIIVMYFHFIGKNAFVYFKKQALMVV